MNAVEFITELSGSSILSIPAEIASILPKSGRARIVVLTDEDADDPQWYTSVYQQFLRDDSPEDAVYDNLK